jgi:glycosyltransferase involved in cell wall biosynthesis
MRPVDSSMKTLWHVSVLIPARNEEELLPRCLASVRRAIEPLTGLATADVVVAADQCTDRTALIAEAELGNLGAVIRVNVGAAGGARGLAAKAALDRLRLPPCRCWLANTDADSIVPAGWLVDQLRLAVSGVEAFAGTVNIDSFEQHGPEVPARFRASYVIGADGSHSHVHGANLGVRADAYIDVGGWANLETAEDHDLWKRLRGMGKRTISTSHIEVVTSGRRHGRAPNGFADCLASHNGVAA